MIIGSLDVAKRSERTRNTTRSIYRIDRGTTRMYDRKVGYAGIDQDGKLPKVTTLPKELLQYVKSSLYHLLRDKMTLKNSGIDFVAIATIISSGFILPLSA